MKTEVKINKFLCGHGQYMSTPMVNSQVSRELRTFIRSRYINEDINGHVEMLRNVSVILLARVCIMLIKTTR